jgi:ferredoxin
MSALRYLANVSTLRLDESRCIGCELCVTVCPHAVFRMENKKASIVDRDACMECGACARNCPVGALEVETGVGCAAAVLIGAFKGTTPDCGCGGSGCCG